MSAYQTLHPNFDGVREGMTSFGQGGAGLKSEAEEGLKAEAEGKRHMGLRVMGSEGRPGGG